MRKNLFLFIVLSMLFIVSCKTQSNLTENKPIEGNQVAPDQALIEAQVLEIVPVNGNFTDPPCTQVPCQAKVKILKILGKGNSFKARMQVGSEITIAFKYTLSGTTDFFPDRNSHLVPLVVGDKFKAKVTTLTKLGIEGDLFEIGDYQKM